MTKRLAMAALGLFLLAGTAACDYKDVVLSRVGADNPAYTTPGPCENAPYHTTFERLGIDRPC